VNGAHSFLLCCRPYATHGYFGPLIELHFVTGRLLITKNIFEEIAMGLMDVLSQYQDASNRPPPDVRQDFEVVSQEADAEELGAGLEEAFRSEQTPPFEQMVGQLYGNSDAHQRAGLLNEIIGSLGPGILGGLAGGRLQDMFRPVDGRPRISPEEAQHIAPADVESITAAAAKQNPGIMERVSRFYAEHPALVQTLGQAALAIAMNTMARRRRM
jgi:hypothetical protein